MKISTAGRYALRVMLDVALNDQAGPVLRQDIAERQEISADYAAQLFRNLSRAGLAKGVMGPGGGYSLSKPAKEIRIGDIFRAVEGPVELVPCVQPGSRPVCKRGDACVARTFWIKLNQMVDDFLNQYTLADLCEQSIEKSHLVPGAYCAQAETLVDQLEALPTDKIDCQPLPE